MSEPITIRVELPPGSLGVEIGVQFGERIPAVGHQARAAQAAEVIPEARRIEAQPATVITFRQAAEAYIAANRNTWKNAKHAEQWTATLERFAYPVIGERSVADIDIRAVLEAMSGQGELVFPGPRGQLSNMALLSVLARMKREDITVHGFRSTFRDWASEATDHPREVAEMALAHTITNKVEAAYRRGDLFEKRRRLMDDWAVACGVSIQPALLQAAE